jgi:3-oxoadipate enol-lactonase
MAMAKLADVDLFYEWEGREGAPAVVFSNSLGTTHQMWNSQVEAFSKDFRILRYDSRGHGQSSVTPGSYHVAQLANDVVQLLDALKIERVFFCGLSIGGMVGMQLGLTSPARLHKLVLCNTAAQIGTPDTWSARITAVQQGGMKAIAGAVIDRWLTAGWRASHAGETAKVQEMVESADAGGYVASCAAVRDADFRKTVLGLQTPTLIIAGSHDPATTPADGQFLESRIRGAKYVELPSAHLSNIEARDEFNQTVLGFLKSQGAHG